MPREFNAWNGNARSIRILSPTFVKSSEFVWRTCMEYTFCQSKRDILDNMASENPKGEAMIHEALCPIFF